MEINLRKVTGSVIPVPLIDGIKLHRDFPEFLVTRYYYPQDIRHDLRGVESGTLRNIAYAIKAVLESLDASGIDVADANYVEHIRPIVEYQLKDATAATFNARMRNIRDYYDFLSNKYPYVKTRFPSKVTSTRYTSLDSDFLSHTRKDNSQRYTKDPSHKKTGEKRDFIGDVISMHQYGKLYEKLNAIDPVFAVMAHVKMQTLLRNADLCEMPLHNNRYNKNIPSWSEFERSGKESLKYKLLTKGSKPLTIDIYPDTLQFIDENYIKLYFSERRELFRNAYLEKDYATMEFGYDRNQDGRRRVPEDILWIMASGTPVKPAHLQDAFRQTGLNVHPHMLRHTGATHALWNYCEENKITPDTRMAAAFMDVLGDQLGHSDEETTKRYVRTILKMKASEFMPFCIPGSKQKLDDHLGRDLVERIQKQMESFFKADVRDTPE